jgi:hypothetical protein
VSGTSGAGGGAGRSRGARQARAGGLAGFSCLSGWARRRSAGGPGSGGVQLLVAEAPRAGLACLSCGSS